MTSGGAALAGRKPLVVTLGARGFIGSILTPVLLADGFRVRAIDRRFFHQEPEQSAGDLEAITADSRQLENAHFKGAAAVVDLAALAIDDAEGELLRYAHEINGLARARNAALAKRAGVRRYVLASAAKLYGDQVPESICREDFPLSPIGSVAKIDAAAERALLAGGGEGFAPIALRLGLAYGVSPRMRFDNPVNRMVHGAAHRRAIPLRRTGKQWRPLIHVMDAARAFLFALRAPLDALAGEAFNVGSADDQRQMGPLAQLIGVLAPQSCEIRWYGEADRFSCRASFEKIEALGWRAKFGVRDAAHDLFARYKAGELEQTPDSYNQRWYEDLVRWIRILRDMEVDGRTLDIGGMTPLARDPALADEARPARRADAAPS